MKEPVMIRLDVEYMKQSMVQAISQYHADIENLVKQSCDNFISSGELQKQLDHAFREAISNEISSYFKYGEGQRNVQEAVAQSLEHIWLKTKNAKNESEKAK